jgi:hypothetical protein
VRVPLLDTPLVEALVRLPQALKQNGGAPKPLLVKALGERLPALVRARREKRGFTFPFDAWLRADGAALRGRPAGDWRKPPPSTRCGPGSAREELHWSRAVTVVLGQWLDA